MQERLQKILAKAGIASRRKAEEMILQGRVTVDDVVVTKLGTKFNPKTSLIKVDGKPIKLAQPFIYLALHKPKGYVTTRFDPHTPPEKTVMSLLPPRYRSLHYVGRLDKDSEGLLLLTNDGELTYLLTHPKHELPKTYVVTLAGRFTQSHAERLRQGVQLDNSRLHTAQAKLLRSDGGVSVVEAVIYEGKKRQVRKMMAALGFEVKRLVRVAIGPLRLGDLPPGKFRQLRPHEVEALKQAVTITNQPTTPALRRRPPPMHTAQG